MILNRFILIFLLLFIFSCNSNKSDEEMDELWSKAQTTGEIINRSGTVSQCKTSPTCPTGTDLGWYVNLQKAQKLTAEPTVDKDRVYFPIYEPSPTSNKCGVGTDILIANDTKCGNSVLNVNMGKGVLSKVVIQDDNLYIGLAGEANENISGFTSKDNLITGKSKAKSASGAVQIESWKENY